MAEGIRASQAHEGGPNITTNCSSISMTFFINFFCGRKGLEEREVGMGIPGKQSAKTGWAEVGCGKHGTHPEIRLSPAKMAPTPYIFIW